MALVHAIPLAHVPSANTAYVSLFRDVRNASLVRDQLLAGNPAFAYAFIDASAILSTSHVLAAVFRAVNDMLCARMKSRNVHSEIVFALSPNNNISQSFSNFGIPASAPSLSGLLAVKISTPEAPVSLESIREHLSNHIDGTAIPFNDDNIRSLHDLPRIKKLYKIQPPGEGKKASGRRKGADANGSSERESATSAPSQLDSVNELTELEAIVIGTMALRGS